MLHSKGSKVSFIFTYYLKTLSKSYYLDHISPGFVALAINLEMWILLLSQAPK